MNQYEFVETMYGKGTDDLICRFLDISIEEVHDLEDRNLLKDAIGDTFEQIPDEFLIGFIEEVSML